MQEMLEAEMTDALGAEKGEHTAARLGYRSGCYTRTLVTPEGELQLRVPQDRDGRFSIARSSCSSVISVPSRPWW
jgi:transposase-like protein